MTSNASASASAAPSGWREFLVSLREERTQCDAPRPLRAMAEEFALRALALMFPQFAHPSRQGAEGVDDEAAHLEALLRAAITPLIPNAELVVAAFLDRLPAVHAMLMEDARVITSGDPAAGSIEEVIISYPGFLATAVHRLSHELYLREVPLFPRVLSEWAHRETGIDIHPGARIGSAFAIDHGTGVVIGETSEIGDRVRIYQGVTLGALAVSKKLQNRKRHPTIGHDVVIYANATILGGTTHVGDRSVIGGNVWLTSSVPERSVVQFTSRVEPRPAPDADGNDDGIEFHI
jgi:serine O-acetyltransferase